MASLTVARRPAVRGGRMARRQQRRAGEQFLAQGAGAIVALVIICRPAVFERYLSSQTSSMRLLGSIEINRIDVAARHESQMLAAQTAMPAVREQTGRVPSS
jgi:hypothetical protein